MVDKQSLSELRSDKDNIKNQWVSVDDEMPNAGDYVLVHFESDSGKKRTVKAAWVDEWTERPKHSKALRDSVHDTGGGDLYYCDRGWHEELYEERIIVRLDEEITHWMPLPRYIK